MRVWTDIPCIYINCAEDTYVVSTSVTRTEYALATLAMAFSPAGQELHPAKCEVMGVTSIEADPPRLWTATQREDFLAIGTRPPLDPSIDRPMKVVQNMIVLGGKLDMTRLQVGAEAARDQAAWGERNDIRPQAQNRAMPLRCRIKLLDSVILPTLLWSLESLQMTALWRRTLDGLQRRLVGRTLLVLRRATESAGRILSGVRGSFRAPLTSQLEGSGARCTSLAN